MIFTVNGPIEKDQMGATLGHEHFKWEYDDGLVHQMYYDKVYEDEEIEKAYQVILPVLKDLYKASCRTIVEASPPIGGQNVKLLRKLSLASGINIIPSTGWNVFKQMYHVFTNDFAENMARKWIYDFEHGLDTIDGVVVRPGYIKLLLDRGELSLVDQAMLIGGVKASKKTGMPIHCHILEAHMVYDVISLLEKENADFSKFLWAHADKEGDLEAIKVAASKGMWIGLDMIKDGTHEEEVKLLKQVIELGFKNQVLLSQDYDFYEEAIEKGDNHPCASFFEKFIPYCKNQGIADDVLEKILKNNPADFYDIKV